MLNKTLLKKTGAINDMAGKKTRFGLSIYSDFYPDEKSIIARLEYAHRLGFTEIFTSLQLSELGFANTRSGLSSKTITLLDKAHDLRMPVHADINREVLEKHNADINDLSEISKVNIPILRLDSGFDPTEIALMTKNTFGIMIEDNLSDYDRVKVNKNEVLIKGNPKQYSGCHNFYPHNDTGLPIEKTVDIASSFHEAGLQTGIFIGSEVSSNDLCSVGHSVPTIEKHRWLPPIVQAEVLLCTEAFDFIIFGDSMPSDEELIQISKCDHIAEEVISEIQADYYRKKFDPSFLKMRVIDIPVYWDQKIASSVQALENMVFYDRRDYPESLIRMTASRNLFKHPPFNLVERVKGSITIDNTSAGHYTGELQILLKDLPASICSNLIGEVKPYGLVLLDFVRDGNIAFRLSSRI